MKSEQTERIRTAAHIAMIAGGLIAVIFGLYMAQSVLAPALLALVFGVVLSPLSDFWERLGLPRGISALISLVLTLLLITVLAGLSLPVAQRVIEAWPTIVGEVRTMIYSVQSLFQTLEEAGRQVEAAMGGQGGEDGGGSIALPSTADALFLAPAVLGQTITFAGVLFFFLLTRTEVYAWIAQHIAPENLEHETAMRLRLAERQVARYFLTITVVNVCFGSAVTICLALQGVPSAALWGIATALLNYVLYLGPAIVFAGLLLTGLVVFENLMSFLPAATFLCLNLIEAQFVTPTAIGRAMHVNPLLVFVALVFFLWLWGPLGGFIAIPTLLWVLTLTKEITATRQTLREKVEEHGGLGTS